MSEIGFCLDLDDSESADAMVATMAAAFRDAMRAAGKRCPALYLVSITLEGRTRPCFLTTSVQRSRAYVRGYEAAGCCSMAVRLSPSLSRS